MSRRAEPPARPGSVAAGAAVASGAQSAAYLCGFVTSIVISRALGAEGRGAYALPATAAGIGVVVAHLSVELANAAAFAEKRHSVRALARGATLLAVVLGPLAVAGLLGFFALTRDLLFPDVSAAAYLVAVASVPFGLLGLWLANVFVLAGHLPRAQTATLCGAVLQLGGVVVLELTGTLTVTTVLAVYSAAVCLPPLLLSWWGRAFAPLSLRGAAPVARELAAQGAKLHGGFLLSFLLMRLDVFYVSAVLTTRDVGLYSLAVLFAELVWLVTSPLAVAVLPHQTATTVEGSAEVTFKAGRFAALIALALAIGLAATLWWFIPRVYGQAFADAYPVVLALLPGVIAIAATRPLVTFLVRQHRPGLWSAISLGAVLLNAALNIVLLDAIGLVGAGVASSAAYLALAAAYVAWAASAVRMPVGHAVRPRRSDAETLWRELRNASARAVRRRTAH